jgi:acetyl-CoA carboxylase biotin carboxyl carrier protein
VANQDGSVPRTPEERLEDHAAIERLAVDLVPALIAKLGASGLGELDVREGDWRVRLRLPVDGRAGRRSAAAGRSAPRAEVVVAPAVGVGPGRSEPPPAPVHAPSPVPAPGHADAVAEPSFDHVPTRVVATSPAVGFFRASPEIPAGSQVRAGDRLGIVDVLGVAHEVVAPVDGAVGTMLVEPGDPVEYGQEIVEIELLGAPAGARAEAG